jgi:hypothetical protein
MPAAHDTGLPPKVGGEELHAVVERRCDLRGGDHRAQRVSIAGVEEARQSYVTAFASA